MRSTATSAWVPVLASLLLVPACGDDTSAPGGGGGAGSSTGAQGGGGGATTAATGPQAVCAELDARRATLATSLGCDRGDAPSACDELAEEPGCESAITALHACEIENTTVDTCFCSGGASTSTSMAPDDPLQCGGCQDEIAALNDCRL